MLHDCLYLQLAPLGENSCVSWEIITEPGGFEPSELHPFVKNSLLDIRWGYSGMMSSSKR